MHQRVAKRGNVVRLPDRTQIADLLRRYSEPLLSPCPSSERLVIFCEDPQQLTVSERETLNRHLEICLDCRDKKRWLEESEAQSYPDSFDRVIWYVLRVRHPGVVEPSRSSYSDGSSGKSGSSASQTAHPDTVFPAETRKVSAPFFVSGDGALCGEIRLDRHHRIYFRMNRMPRSFQWHALHIRALTFDRRVLVSGTRTISGPNFHINHPPRITPGDLDRVELGLVPLR